MTIINNYNLNINQILRRKKHYGQIIIGDKRVSSRQLYKPYIHNLSNKYRNNIISICNYNGQYTKLNTTNLLKPTINMVGFSFNDRIKHLQKLFKHGRLKLENSSKQFKKLIGNSQL